jgi:hypothetical protein
VIFDSTVTINNSTANFITFEQCTFAGAISIASNVTATVYFDRCNLGNQLITSSRSGAGSPLLTILTECSGVNLLQTNLTSNVVTVGRTGYNDLSVKQFQNADVYVYDLNNGLSTSFSGSYSELRNKPTIPTSSDDLTEGSTNLFYTNSRFDTRLATKTTDNLTEGTTNKYFSDTLARNAFSAGTGITITSGQIATTITQYTDALAKSASVVNSMGGSQTDQAPSVSSVKAYYTAGTGISIVGGQISATGTSASRPTYSTESSFPLNLGSVDYTGVIKRKYYISNGASAVTINLPAIASNDGLELVFKLLGTGTATLDANASETIDGALTFALSLQNSSVTLTATSAGWRIE